METTPTETPPAPPPSTEAPPPRVSFLTPNRVMFAIGGLIVLLMILSVGMQNMAHRNIAKKCLAGDISVCTALIEAKSTPEKQRGGYYAIRGFHYAQKSEYDKAIEDFNSAIGTNTAQVEVYAFRASTYTKMARYSEAIADFNTAIRMSPKTPDYYCGLIDAEYRKGDAATGDADLQRLKTMAPRAACIEQLTPAPAPATGKP